MIGLTALAALAAVLLAVGLAAVQTDRRPPIPIEQIAPRDGRPPLALDLGVRTDTEAVALRRASALYAQGKLDDALAVFERHNSLEARVGKAFARWPERTVDRLVSLSGLHPSSALVQLHLGLALFWTKRPGEEEAWRAALSAEPDTSYAVTAENLLFQEFAPGIPIFFPSVALPEPARGLRADRQLAAFRQLAGEGDRAGTLYYGIALQRLGKRVSAQKVLGLYAREHPRDAEAQVAAAVARFLKGDPSAAFSRLGPLEPPLSPTLPPCASTSACSCSGPARSRRRDASCVVRSRSSPGRPLPARRSGTWRGCQLGELAGWFLASP